MRESRRQQVMHAIHRPTSMKGPWIVPNIGLSEFEVLLTYMMIWFM